MDAYGSLGYERGVELQRDEAGNVVRGIRQTRDDGGEFFDVPQDQADRYSEYVTRGGKQWYRLGTDPENYIIGANKYAPQLTSSWTKDNFGAIYDPQAGWIAPASVTDPITQVQNQAMKVAGDKGWGGGPGPWLTALSLVAPAIGSSIGAAGGLGATLSGPAMDAASMSQAAGTFGNTAISGSGLLSQLAGFQAPAPVTDLTAGAAGATAGAGAEGITQAAVNAAGMGTGAFDMGQFNPSDVGLDASTFPAADALTSGTAADPFATGAVDQGLFAPSDVGLDTSTFPGSNVTFPSDGGGSLNTSAEAFNSGSVDSSSSVDPGAYRYETPDTISDGGSGVQSAIDKLLKYGPLGLGVAGALQSRRGVQQFADQLRQLGGPQRALGEQLLQQYQSGQLNPADAARISEWEQGAIAQSRQFFARAGTSSSTQSNSTEQSIRQKAEAMRQQALQGTLKIGLDALNVTDRYQAAAIQAEMQGDAQARANALQFISAYGAWLRALPQITGSA